MSFGFSPFASAAFSDEGSQVANVTVAATGLSLAASVSNDYQVQGTHHVSGNTITSAQGNEAIVLSQIPTSNAITSAINSVTVTATANVTVTGNSATATLGSPDPQVIAAAANNLLGLAINSVTVTADAGITASTNAITSAINSVIPKLEIAVTGNSITAAQNSIIPSIAKIVTGQ